MLRSYDAASGKGLGSRVEPLCELRTKVRWGGPIGVCIGDLGWAFKGIL